MALATVQFSLATLFWPRNGIVCTGAFLLFAAAISMGTLVWIPRATASRLAAEVREGLSTVAEQQRRRRRGRWICLIAVTVATAPIVVAWFIRW